MSEKLVTKGIVLRATATKEADYILNILTDSLGRIAVVARGARRKGSRIAAGSEPATSASPPDAINGSASLAAYKTFILSPSFYTIVPFSI